MKNDALTAGATGAGIASAAIRPAPAYVFSIGLNRGAGEPAGQLSATLYALSALTAVQDLALGVSEWQGARERYIQARALTVMDPEHAARNMAAYLGQDCISVLNADGAGWRLVHASGEVEAGGSIAEYPLILTNER